jgi:hypothetical protein
MPVVPMQQILKHAFDNRMAAKELGVPPEVCVVMEDSNNGVESAYSAKMKCVLTISSYTREENYSHASIVLTCLGDPGGEKCEMLQNRAEAGPVDCFRVSNLEAVLSGGKAAAH